MPERAEKRARARRARDAAREIALEGLGVSPGVAIGPVHLHEHGEVQVAERALEPKEIPEEIERFRAAVAKSIKQLGKLKTKGEALPGDVAEEIGFLLEAHAQMLEGSRLVRGVEARIASDRINAEAAVHAEVATIAQTFEAMEDSYLAAPRSTTSRPRRS
jgi:phosphotransferase system enzyme I (PtsI)